MLRVITGTVKGTHLKVPETGLRPATDLVRGPCPRLTLELGSFHEIPTSPPSLRPRRLRPSRCTRGGRAARDGWPEDRGRGQPRRASSRRAARSGGPRGGRP